MLGADDEDDARGAGIDRLDALVHGSRAGGTGILHSRCTFEAQIGRGLEHQRGGKILRGKTRVEVAKHDLVDVLGSDAGVSQRIAGHPHDQAFDGLTTQFTKGGVGPPDNTGRHCCLLCRTLVAFLGNELRSHHKYEAAVHWLCLPSKA